MAGLNDTSPEAEEVLREAYRKMPFATKLRQMGVLYRTAPACTRQEFVTATPMRPKK